MQENSCREFLINLAFDNTKIWIMIYQYSGIFTKSTQKKPYKHNFKL